MSYTRANDEYTTIDCMDYAAWGREAERVDELARLLCALHLVGSVEALFALGGDGEDLSFMVMSVKVT